MKVSAMSAHTNTMAASPARPKPKCQRKGAQYPAGRLDNGITQRDGGAAAFAFAVQETGS